MAAIVTNKFRVLNAENFKTDLETAATSTYIYIAKSDAWSDDIADVTDTDAPTPTDTQAEENDVHDNMIAMKRITSTDVSHVVPRHDWTNGSSYVAWDDADPAIYDKAFYVVTDEFKVYKCVAAGAGASTVKPTQTNTQLPVAEGDGYKWKYMYTIQAADADKFLTNFYIPIKTVIDTGGLAAGDQTQHNGQVDAQTFGEGKIYRIIVTNGGTGYTVKPTVTIVGDGTGATITASEITLNNGAVSSIDILIANAGSGYTQADVVISGGDGTGATARAVISPGVGHGTDPVSELGAFYIATNAKLDGNAGAGDFIVDNSFRQVGLIRNPLNFNPADLQDFATATTLSGLQTMVVSDATNINVGDVLQGATNTTARVIVDAVDIATNTVKYHQNFKTDWDDLAVQESLHNLTIANDNVASVVSFGNPEYDRYSGDILFIENRGPVNRDATQIEDVKIIIEF